jgi:hypothetical protein
MSGSAPGQNAGARSGSTAPNALEKMQRRPFAHEPVRRSAVADRGENRQQLTDGNRYDHSRRDRLLHALGLQRRITLTAASHTRPTRNAAAISRLTHDPSLTARPLATSPLGLSGLMLIGLRLFAENTAAAPAGRQNHADGRDEQQHSKQPELHTRAIIPDKNGPDHRSLQSGPPAVSLWPRTDSTVRQARLRDDAIRPPQSFDGP